MSLSMGIHVITANRALSDTLKTALRPGDVTTFTRASDAISHLFGESGATSELLVVDLMLADTVRFLSYLKLSSLRDIPVIALAPARVPNAIPPSLSQEITMTLYAPANESEVLLVAARIQHEMRVRNLLREKGEDNWQQVPYPIAMAVQVKTPVPAGVRTVVT